MNELTRLAIKNFFILKAKELLPWVLGILYVTIPIWNSTVNNVLQDLFVLMFPNFESWGIALAMLFWIEVHLGLYIAGILLSRIIEFIRDFLLQNWETALSLGREELKKKKRTRK